MTDRYLRIWSCRASEQKSVDTRVSFEIQLDRQLEVLSRSRKEGKMGETGARLREYGEVLLV